MIILKSEISKILGKIEDLEVGSTLTGANLYVQLEHAYLLISDHFEIDQCHSIIHQFRNQMRILRPHDTDHIVFSDKENELEEVKKAAIKELTVFISHL